MKVIFCRMSCRFYSSIIRNLMKYSLSQVNSDSIFIPVGFLPKNYIRSGAFSKSNSAVSPRDTGFIPKDRKKTLRDNLIIST